MSLSRLPFPLWLSRLPFPLLILGLALLLACAPSPSTAAQRASGTPTSSVAGAQQVQISGTDSLTASERRVAKLAADGNSNREIAEQLFISPHTVRTHLEHIFEKLDVHTRTAAVLRAFHEAGPYVG